VIRAHDFPTSVAGMPFGVNRASAERMPDHPRGSATWMPRTMPSWNPSRTPILRPVLAIDVSRADLTVVDVDDTEQTFSSLIGQRLTEKYRHLPAEFLTPARPAVRVMPLLRCLCG
jgi:hypothetical protein